MAKGLVFQFTSTLGRHQHLVWQGDDIPSGLNLPKVDDSLVKSYRRSIWNLSQAPRTGRYYPSRFLPGTHERPVFRLLHVDDQQFTGDRNPPIAYLQGRLSEIEDEHLPMGNGGPEQILEWAGMECPLRNIIADFNEPGGYDRENDDADDVFYQVYRPVRHVDTLCAQRIEHAYGQLIPEGAQVLDLMASLYTHLEGEYEVTGLGMNEAELRNNARLNARVTHDLNQLSRLPFPDASFDAVINTVSFEYLIQPWEVLREIRRVLKPGGRLVISFSNRYFPTKAISLWISLHPMERLGWVLQLLQDAGFEDLASHVERGLPRPADDPHIAQLTESDPLWIAWGRQPGS